MNYLGRNIHVRVHVQCGDIHVGIENLARIIQEYSLERLWNIILHGDAMG